MTDEEIRKSWEVVEHVGRIDHVCDDGMLVLGSEFGKLHKAIQDLRLEEVYLILNLDYPEIVDFTFYTDRESVEKRVLELNKLSKESVYWYVTLYRNGRNFDEKNTFKY